jgi:hypothetical protein
MHISKYQNSKVNLIAIVDFFAILHLIKLYISNLPLQLIKLYISNLPLKLIKLYISYLPLTLDYATQGLKLVAHGLIIL